MFQKNAGHEINRDSTILRDTENRNLRPENTQKIERILSGYRNLICYYFVFIVKTDGTSLEIVILIAGTYQQGQATTDFTQELRGACSWSLKLCRVIWPQNNFLSPPRDLHGY